MDAPFACVLRAWHAHEVELRGYLRKQTRAADHADDLVQEVFIRAMRQGHAFCVLDNPRAWLFQVARHALIDAARREPRVVELPNELPQAVAPAPQPVDELDACIARKLAELDPGDRDILSACDLRGQTVRAYAQVAGLTLAAAKSRLRRARQQLREALTRGCDVQFDAAGDVCCSKPNKS